MADIDGDGLKDLIGFGVNDVYVSYSLGDGTLGPAKAILQNFAENAGGWTSFDQFPRTACDVNGDGKDDLVGFGSSCKYYFLSLEIINIPIVTFVALSTGSGVEQPYSATQAFSYNADWKSFNTSPRLCFDMDGDGYADLIGFANDGVYIAWGNGRMFADPVKVVSNFSPLNGGWSSFDKFPRCVGKMSSASRVPASIIGFGQSSIFVSHFQSRNKYSEPIGVSNSFVVDDGWASFQTDPRLCTDMNGDGIVDIVGFGADQIYVAYGTESGFSFMRQLKTDMCMCRRIGWTSFDKYPR